MKGQIVNQAGILPNVIPLSKAGIEKRKRALYSVFNIKENSDRQLIIEAKKSGFI